MLPLLSPTPGPQSLSKRDARLVRALHRRDRSTRRPRTWVQLPSDGAWLAEEVGTPYVRQVLSGMVRKGTMFRDGHGRYVLAPPGGEVIEQTVPPQVLIDAALAPHGDYYIGFMSAIVEHALTDESEYGFYAAVHEGRFVGHQEIAGRPLHLVRVTSGRKWVGIEQVRLHDRMSYRRSNLERTLLDAVDRPRLCGGMETIVRAWERASRLGRLDDEQMVDLATSIGGAVGLRAAFWLSRLDREASASAIIDRLGGPGTSGTLRLDPSNEYAPESSARDRATGVRVNVPEELIRGWISYAK